MTTRPSKPLFDPPPMRQLSIEEAPNLYEDGVYYPGAAIPGFEPEVSPVTQPSIEEAPHLYEDGIFYPATDGAPLPDGAEQYHEFLHVNTLLQIHYADQPRIIVSGNTFVYYDQGRPGRNIAPDCYVAFDVNRDEIISQEHYRIWVVGKPPDFALEIASKHTAHNDLVPKRELYAAIGIGEYWRYDPTEDSRYYGERLVGERLVDGEYQRLPVAPDAEESPARIQPYPGAGPGLGRAHPAVLRPGNRRMAARLRRNQIRAHHRRVHAGRRARRPRRRRVHAGNGAGRPRNGARQT